MKLPHITSKQQEILLLIYRFRFLNRIQIQKLLNHKNPKNTNVWLKDLTDKGLIRRIYERKVGINAPAIYFISTAGIKFLRSLEGIEKSYLKRLSQENRRSDQFIKQCIVIADLYLNLNDQNHPGFKFYTNTDFPLNGVIRQLSPSCAYVIEQNGQPKHVTCEIFRDGTPRFALRSRILEYINFFSAIEGQEILVNLYCPNDKLAKYVDTFSSKALRDEETENIRFNVFSLHATYG